MDEPLTAETVRAAVHEGIVDAASDPEVWATVFDAAGRVLQERARAEAGGWLFGGVRVVFSRIAWLVLAGLAIYLLGGWTALIAFLKQGALP